jgi:hypothetical protein
VPFGSERRLRGAIGAAVQNPSHGRRRPSNGRTVRLVEVWPVLDDPRFDVVGVGVGVGVGKAPYIRAWETDGNGAASGGDFRVISHRGAGGGWVCFSYGAYYHVAKIRVTGSVANTPSVPEPTIATINC